MVIVLVSRIQKSGTGYNDLANAGKEPSRIDQFGPSSKVFPNILVGANRNDPFHLISNPAKFPEFWSEWKAPTVPYNDL